MLYLKSNTACTNHGQAEVFSVIDGIDYKWKDSYIYLIMKNDERYYITWKDLEEFKKTEDLTLEVDQASGDHLSLSFWI